MPAAEDLVSGMLTAFPQRWISAQDALLHGFFSPLPPQLYQVPAGELTLDFTSPRMTYFTCHLLQVSSVLRTQTLCLCLPSLPVAVCCKIYIPVQIPQLVFPFSSTKLIIEGDLDGMPPWCTLTAEVFML